MASLLRKIGFIGMFVTIGIIIGLLLSQLFFMQSDLTYKNTALVTCNYANQMTDVLNNQTSALEMCMDKPENDLVRIGKLNCSLLSDD